MFSGFKHQNGDFFFAGNFYVIAVKKKEDLFIFKYEKTTELLDIMKQAYFNKWLTRYELIEILTASVSGKSPYISIDFNEERDFECDGNCDDCDYNTDDFWFGDII